MPVYRDRCPVRYTLGAHIMFLVCGLVDGHAGRTHWDDALEVAWSTERPDLPLAVPLTRAELEADS